jgi:hypothetical protein
MLSRDFCFWLQGFFELSETDRITADQAMLIRRHLDLVFSHEDFLIMRETPAPAPSPTKPEPAREAPPEPWREPQPVEPALPPARC